MTGARGDRVTARVTGRALTDLLDGLNEWDARYVLAFLSCRAPGDFADAVRQRRPDLLPDSLRDPQEVTP